MGTSARAATITRISYNYSVGEYSFNSTNLSNSNGGCDLTTNKVFCAVD